MDGEAEPAAGTAPAAALAPVWAAPLGWRILAGTLVGVGLVGAIQFFAFVITGAATVCVPYTVNLEPLEMAGWGCLCAALAAALVRGRRAGQHGRLRPLKPLLFAIAGAILGSVLALLAHVAINACIDALAGGSLGRRALTVALLQTGRAGHPAVWMGWIAGVFAASRSRSSATSGHAVERLAIASGVAGALIAAWGVARSANDLTVPILPWAPAVATLVTCAAYGVVLWGGGELGRRLDRWPASVARPLTVAGAGLLWVAGCSAAALSFVVVNLLTRMPSGGTYQFILGALQRGGADVATVPMLLLLVVGIAWFGRGRRAHASEAA